jgi:uncharacterized protein (PEP-CTERM system associated)
MMDMAMTRTELARRFALAIGLTLAATAASAQDAPPPSLAYGAAGGSEPAQPDYGQSGYGQPEAAAPEAQAAPRERRPRRVEVAPYLEVSAGIAHEFGGETLTYATAAAGIDGRVETRRVTAVVSYRYDRSFDIDGNVGDQDQHSGIAQLSAQVVPGAVQLDAGAMATRTGGQGRAIGLSQRDDAVEVYAGYVGPSVSTHAGPVAINASYRLGYVAVDDDSVAGGPTEDYDSSISHSASASVGMAPGRLPFGWTVGGGVVRSDDRGEFRGRLEGEYVRGDVVVPLGPTIALTAGVGYERIRSSQRDLLRDGTGTPLIVGGRPVADPNAPRLLTYNVDGMIYDGGVIWRPSPRTELQARAGHRYGGTTVVGSFSHRFNQDYGVSAAVYDTVETFGNSLTNSLSNLPQGLQITRNPVTGDLGDCVFGQTPGSGACLGRSLQSVRGGTFRARGGNLTFSGSRRLWSFGAGVAYDNRRYQRPNDPAFDAFGGFRDESWTLFGNVGRQLSRSSDLSMNAYASVYDSDEAGFDRVFSTGGTVSYSRRFLLDRLQLMAALGLNHSDDGTEDSTVASGVAGLRYTFW